jgi:cytochrome P450
MTMADPDATASAEPSLDEGITAVLSGKGLFLSNPYPFFRRLREESPVHWFAPGTAVVSTYPEAREVHSDNRRFLAGFSNVEDLNVSLLSPEEVAMVYDWEARFRRNWMFTMDGEKHKRFRGAISRLFTQKRIEEMGDVAQRVINEWLLGHAGDQAASDMVQLAYKVPLAVVATLFGIPVEETERFRIWNDESSNMEMRGVPLEPANVRKSDTGLRKMTDYVEELTERKRRSSDRTELVHALLSAEEEDRLSEAELAATMSFLLSTGYETTSKVAVNGLLAILRERDQWSLLCSDRTLVVDAVEELLRFDSSIVVNEKIAATDVELKGVKIPAGTSLLTLTGAANHDPQAFWDPDHLDITRHPNEHLTLGRGVHFCLGANLLRMEMQILFTTLSARFPDIELAVPADAVVWESQSVLRSPKELPVHLGQARSVPA